MVKGLANNYLIEFHPNYLYRNACYYFIFHLLKILFIYDPLKIIEYEIFNNNIFSIKKPRGVRKLIVKKLSRFKEKVWS